MIRTHHHYRQLLKTLLPPGLALSAESGSTLHLLLDGLAPEFARIDARAAQLIPEATPDTTEEMLADWERVLGFPDGCLPRDGSEEARREAVLAKLRAQGGQSADYFIALAESMGYPGAQVSEFRPFNCNSPCTDALYSHPWRFVWLINVKKLPPGNEPKDRALECLLNRYKPAHTHVLVRYSELPDFGGLIASDTEKMLKLFDPEVSNHNIQIVIDQQPVPPDYIGPITGHCDVDDPTSYYMDMYVHTTSPYKVGTTDLQADGRFSFPRTWPGAKHFRLMRRSDSTWIDTLEFPMVIRSYWMTPETPPDVVRIMADRCYTYDQAVAALALMVQDHPRVDQFTRGLISLVDPEGAVAFFVNRLSGQPSAPYYRLGNAAWVLYALAFYLEKNPTGALVPQVTEKLNLGLSWLHRWRVGDTSDRRHGLYTGGHGRYVNGVFDDTYVPTWCALEHNVDIWFLFDLLGQVGFDGYANRAAELAQLIVSKFWMEDEGRLRQGVDIDRDDNAGALDQSSWGGLFLDHVDPAKARRAHVFMERFAYETIETFGYTPYLTELGYPNARPYGVWTEGTMGAALFERQLGNDERAVELIRAMSPLNTSHGYRDSTPNDPDHNVLSNWPSTTNTGWVILAAKPSGFWKVRNSS